MNKNKIIDVLRLVAGNNIMVAVTHRRNGITSNVIVNKVFLSSSSIITLSNNFFTILFII